MCNERNSALFFGHKVDACLVPTLDKLNSQHIKILGCCCGHKIYPETIIIKDSWEGIFEYNSGAKIPRAKRFYRKDLNGFYYISEVSKPKEHS